MNEPTKSGEENARFSGSLNFPSRANTPLHYLNIALTRILEVLAIVAMSALVLDVVWGVGTRYLLGEQAKWTEELARFLLIWVSMLGGALAFRRREHLGIDFAVEMLHPAVRRSTQIFKHSIVCFAAIAVFLYGGFRIVLIAWQVAQTTPALGWKMGYVYLAVPLAGIFILLFAIEEMLQAAKLAEQQPEESPTSSPAKEEL